MFRFIKVIDSDNKRHLINIDYIVHISEYAKNTTYIYFKTALSTADSSSLACLEIKESYDNLTSKIFAASTKN